MQAHSLTLGQKLAQWHPQAIVEPLYRLHFKSRVIENLQLKICRKTKAIVIVQIDLYEQFRGQGFFTRLVAKLQQTYGKVIVECPQPRLKAWCLANKIEIRY